jgi:hypothetical protein
MCTPIRHTPQGRRPQSAPPLGRNNRRPSWSNPYSWKPITAAEKLPAFVDRVGWQTKLPPNDPSFLEKIRKETHESPATKIVRIRCHPSGLDFGDFVHHLSAPCLPAYLPACLQDEDGFKRLLERVNRPQSAPPKQRGGGVLQGWTPAGRLEVARYQGMSKQDSWPIAAGAGVKWSKARGGLDISDRPKGSKVRSKSQIANMHFIGTMTHTQNPAERIHQGCF